MDASFERPGRCLSGYLMIGVVLFLGLVGLILFIASAPDVDGGDPEGGLVLLGILCWILGGLAIPGFFINQPNLARVVTLFGSYQGTIRDTGFNWTNPLTKRQSVSLRVLNFDSQVLKVNDAAGNPIEIAAVVTWQVVDTAKAFFDVQSYDDFVAIQSETAVRHVASTFPYESYEAGKPSLRTNADDVMATLTAELQERLAIAGVRVLEARLRRLAYSPEIAQEMLRRQQADAVVAARQRIVEGAVGMVEMALQMLSEQHIVELDEERKAAMVSNLLVVLCSDRGAQPVVNSGSLYT
jgi:regulator of protease activity HflC (stomatin/prohibitin superfamily)